MKEKKQRLIMTDQMQSEIAELNSKLEEIDDPRRSYAMVQERIRLYRTLGREVPQELVRIERRLLNDCLLESRGG
jgi:hypothetical protein